MSKRRLLASDYVALAKENQTVAREFERFKKDVFVHTLVWEGVKDPSRGGSLHNVAGDSGGWTIWGIAYNHNKDLFTDLADFKDTTYEEAAAIAYIKYYRASQAFVLPREVQLKYFDMCYNLGVNRAVRLMQECAGVTADGVIGPVTRSRMVNVTVACLEQKRNTFYNNLVARNSSLSKFLRGWLNRSRDIARK